MEYSKKLSHPKWQKRRLERLSEENFSCQICNNENEELHVHHLYYDKDKDVWEYPNKALIVLCKTHHDYEHSIEMDVKNDLFDSFKRAGFTNSSLLHIIIGLRAMKYQPASPNLVAHAIGNMFSNNSDFKATYEKFKDK